MEREKIKRVHSTLKQLIADKKIGETQSYIENQCKVGNLFEMKMSLITLKQFRDYLELQTLIEGLVTAIKEKEGLKSL